MSQNARHNSILNRFGLAATRKSRCAALSGSRRDCLRAACAYRPAGYVSAAACYDPRAEVPGYFWGARERAVTRDAPTPVYDEADVIIAQRLLRLDPFPGAGLNRLTAQQTQSDPAPLSDEEQRLIAKQRVIAQSIYDTLQRANAFDEPDVSIVTLDAQGKPKIVELTPGDQLYYSGAFGYQGAQHHGIYIGQGYVIEVGGGGVPAITGIEDVLCALNLKSSPAKGIVGLSRLQDFNRPGKQVSKIVYREQDRLPRRETIRRAIELLGRWNYRLQQSNCEHFATYVATGRYRSEQIQKVVDAAETYVLKPARSVLRLLDPESGAEVPATGGACRHEFYGARQAPESCVEKYGVAATRNAPGRSAQQYVQLICNDPTQRTPATVSCHKVEELARSLRSQKRHREPYHDPATGYLLDDAQVRIIRNAAATRRK